MIKNIIFDIGNVLADFSWREHMVEQGFSEECIEILTKNMIQHPLWDELDLGKRHHTEVIADMKALSPQYADEIDCYFANPMGIVRPRVRSAELVVSLKERGYGIYLLSNYPAWLFELHSSRFDFLKYADGMVISSYVKMMKPDPAIYKILLEKYSLNPEECVFLDDREVNIEAAEKLGIRSIICSEQDQFESQLERVLNE